MKLNWGLFMLIITSILAIELHINPSNEYTAYGNELIQAIEYFNLPSNEKLEITEFNAFYHCFTLHPDVIKYCTGKIKNHINNFALIDYNLLNLLKLKCKYNITLETININKIYNYINYNFIIKQYNCNHTYFSGGTTFEVFALTNNQLLNCQSFDNNNTIYKINCQTKYIINTINNNNNCINITIFIENEFYESFYEKISKTLNKLLINNKQFCLFNNKTINIIENNENINQNIMKLSNNIDIYNGFWIKHENLNKNENNYYKNHSIYNLFYQKSLNFNITYHLTTLQLYEKLHENTSNTLNESIHLNNLNTLNELNIPFLSNINNSINLYAKYHFNPILTTNNPQKYHKKYHFYHSNNNNNLINNINSNNNNNYNINNIRNKIKLLNHKIIFIGSSHLRYIFDSFLTYYYNNNEKNENENENILLKFGKKHNNYIYKNIYGYVSGNLYSNLYADDQSDFIQSICNENSNENMIKKQKLINEKLQNKNLMKNSMKNSNFNENFTENSINNENLNNKMNENININENIIQNITIIIQTGAFDLQAMPLKRLLKIKISAQKLINIINNILNNNNNCNIIKHIIFMTSMPYPLCYDNNQNKELCDNSRQYRMNSAIAASNQFYMNGLLANRNVNYQNYNENSMKNENNNNNNISVHKKLTIIDSYNIIKPTLLFNEELSTICVNHYMCRLDDLNDQTNVIPTVHTISGDAIMETLLIALAHSNP